MKKRSAMVMELTEELTSTPMIQGMTAQNNRNVTTGTTIRQAKGIYEFMQGSSDEDEDDDSSSDPFAYAGRILNNYMNSSNEALESLNDHKATKYLFLKYNTTIRSSASSERLFIMAKHVLKLSRLKLSDRNFQEQLLLNVNSMK